MRRYMWAVIATVSTVTLLLVALLSSTASAATLDTVNVQVNDSSGTGLPGVTIHDQCGTSTLLFGTTDSSGQVSGSLPDGASCTVTAIYRNTSASQTDTITDNMTFTFKTSAVKVTLSDHSGGPLAGGTASYKSGSTIYLNGTGSSTTDASGAVTGQLFDGTYDFRMVYNTGTEWKNGVTISGDTTVPFLTGELSIVYSNDLAFGQGNPNSTFFTKAGTELLPGTYLFNPHGSGCSPLSIVAPDAGTSATKSIFAAHLVDSSSAALAGGTAKWANGSWHTMGTTDTNGWVCQVVDGALGNVKVAMTYHQGTEQLTQNIATNSIFNYQTALGTIRLIDHNGNGLAGGTVDQGGGYWDTGIATTDASGYAYVELFSGHTYKFRMDYNHLSQIKTGDPTATPLVFQTGQLILHYSGNIQGSLGGSWVSFSPPTVSEELFAGTYNFKFDGYYLPMTVTVGTSNEQSIIVAKLTNHYGQAIAGGTAKWAGGSWNAMPDTNSGGMTGVAVPGTLGNVTVAMTYHQGTEEITQSQPTNSFYAFQTAQGVIRLVDHNGNGLAGGTVDQGGGFWDTGIATTNASGYAYVELFPGHSYKFQMNYNNTSEQKISDPTTSPMVFQTGSVHSDSGTATQWAGGAWHPFTQDMEVLPGYYHFQFSDSTPVTYYTISAATVNHIH
ncbi:MAG: hypothetical protein WBW04_02225 [Nitrolancea sp.]